MKGNHSQMVEYTEIATAPPAKRDTPANPPEIPSSICGTPNLYHGQFESS